MQLGPKKRFYIFNKTICGIYRFIIAVFILLQLDSWLHFLLYMLYNHNSSRKNTSVNLTEWVTSVTTFSCNPFSSLQLHKSNKFYQIWQFVYCIYNWFIIPFQNWMVKRIIDGLGLIRLFFWFPERCFWASSVLHVVSVQQVNLMARAS